MLSNSPDPSPDSTPAPDAEVQIPYSRLTALLSLFGENPSTLEPLLHEVRATQFVVPVDGRECVALEEASLFCNELEGSVFGIAFLKESDAHAYLSEYKEPYSLMLCKGSDVVTTLIQQETPLGLYLVDGQQGYFLNAKVLRIGAGILSYQDSDIEHVECSPAQYGGEISKQLRRELELLCSKHPHIERVYLADISSSQESHGSSFIIVGDYSASPVNIQDLLCVIAEKFDILNWRGMVTWIDKEGEEFMRQNDIDLVYARKN